MKSVKKLIAVILAGALALGSAVYLPIDTQLQMQVQAAEAYSYKTVKDNQTYKGNKSTITVKHYYKRVVLNGSGEAIKFINSKLKSYSDKFMKDSAAFAVAKSDCKVKKKNETYKDYVTQKVTFLSDEVVSIQATSVWYAGGVSNKNTYGYTFDLKTGKRITKITSVTKSTSLDKIKSSLQKKIKADKLDASVLEDKKVNTFDFYIAEDGKVVVCFAPYALNQGGNAVTYTLQGRYEAEPVKTPTNEELYNNAVKDAVFADSDEICPLVTIDQNSDMVTWNESGDKVLLLTWHKYPSSYPAGQEVATKWGEVWTFTDKEMIKWYKEHKKELEKNPTLRLEQLIGLPEGDGNTTVTAFWVDPKDVIRPAYVTDITAQMTNASKESETEFDKWYTEWFNDNIIWSYFDSAYPWTRLGYTYDWADNGQEYGLSEFLVCKNSKVDVEFTMTTEEFLAWLDKQ